MRVCTDYDEAMKQIIQPSSLSPSELHVYRYLLKNYRLARDMTIRELSAASYSSTSSIMRLVRKFGYPGYAEFQSSLQKNHTCAEVFFRDEREFSLHTFFDIICEDEEFQYSLKRAAAVLAANRNILFTGDAYGICARESGMRLFGYYGWQTGFLEDHPVRDKRNGVCVVAIIGSADEAEAKQIASSLPVGSVPVILIYFGGFKPSLPCDEICCTYGSPHAPKAISMIPAVHTLELLQKQVILLS